MKTVETTVKFSTLPKLLQLAFRNAGITKNKVEFKIHYSDSIPVSIHNTHWDGGTRYMYRQCPVNMFTSYGPPFDSDNAVQLPGPTGYEGSEYRLTNAYLIVHGHFCGKEFTPRIEICVKDIPLFFDYMAPSEVGEMPAELFADWLEENSESVLSREKTRMRKAAIGIRTVLGLI